MTEADTCRKFVVPRLQAAWWDTPPHLINEQRTFTDGRIIFAGGKARRGRQKRADYLLRYRPDFPIAVVEAKAAYRQAGDALQQAKEYAEILGLKFAYATNGTEIIEFDYTTGVERTVTAFPEPDELWRRLRAAEGIEDESVAEKLLAPNWPDRARPLRYYQEIAVNRATQGGAAGAAAGFSSTLCTGSGKTAGRVPGVLEAVERALEPYRPASAGLRSCSLPIATSWWTTPWPRTSARSATRGAKISGAAVKSRDMYFAIYQGDRPRRTASRPLP